jgi:hypothetical protein
MPEISLMVGACVALALLTIQPASVTATEDSAALRTELKSISQHRIYFGHQSVGVNLLDGIRQLGQAEQVPLNIIETPMVSNVLPNTIGHTFIDRNGDPLQKLKSFEIAFGQQPTKIDIAFMKFCYIDFSASTDTKALFTQYQTTIKALQARNPHTVFVHVTAPLTGKTGGVKGFAKTLLGRDGSVENVRREEYNSLLRNAYQGREPVFDLARVESVDPNGEKVTSKRDGRSIPAMASEYTDDGGHLNTIGRLKAARELVSVLASTLSKPTPVR